VTSHPMASGSFAHASVASCWPSLKRRLAPCPDLEQKVEALLSTLSLREKVGQMIQAEIRSVTPEEVQEYRLGSILSGGGAFPGNDKHASVEDWQALADAHYEASMAPRAGGPAIPVLWGVDAVHGHNNLFGATLFPHNIGLGAARDGDLLEAIAAATARELLATGVDWNFAPTVAVVRDDLWGRSYEGYAEDPALVQDYARRFVRGLQGDLSDPHWMRGARVVATAKHFIGDGGTTAGVDQGDNVDREEVLCNIHGAGYFSAIEEGALTVMASFNSWQGLKVHGHGYLLTEVLKGRLGFDGVVVSDWNGHQQVDGYHSDSCRQTVLAGVDMIMVPEQWAPLLENTIAEVERGDIPLARIDDAVRRILRMKLRAGLFEREKPSQRPVADASVVGCDTHRALAREAARKSMVLLKNAGGLLPLAPGQRVLVAGDGAHNVAKQCGGWTLTWQGTQNQREDFPGATSLWEGIEAAVGAAGGTAELSPDGAHEQRPDVAVVVFGEDPYAEGVGDRTHLSHSAENPEDLELLKRLKAEGIPVVAVLLSGRPLWVNPELNASDAFIAAWLPGSEGGALADLLFDESQRFDFTGRLSFSWPARALQSTVNLGDQRETPLFPYGYGLSLGDEDTLGEDLSEEDEAEVVLEKGEVVVFDRTPQGPYGLYLGDPLNWRLPVRSTLMESAAGALSLRTVDVRRQEDARRARWNGRAPAQLYFQTATPHDFKALGELGGVLTVTLLIHEAPTAPVFLRMDGTYPRAGALDVTEILGAQQLEQEVVLSWPLQAWADAGAPLEHIDTPFLLWTKGRLELTLLTVKITALGSA